MENIPDYYDALGLGEDCTEAQVKAAFRKKAKDAHPDRGGDPDAFKRLNEAHEVLSDPEKRSEYERLRKYGSGAGDFSGVDLDDFFGSFFGQGSGFSGFGGGGGFHRGPARGRDSLVEADVPFTVAAIGGAVSLRTSDDKRLEVNVPAGTVHGAKLRLRGQGQAGHAGGPAGDLLVRIKVAPHPDFRRDGDDIVSTVTVDWLDCVLGGQTDVSTLHGTVELTLPPGLQSGNRLRVPGFGIRKPSRSGDHHVIVKARLPEQPTGRELELLEDLRELRDAPPSTEVN